MAYFNSKMFPYDNLIDRFEFIGSDSYNIGITISNKQYIMVYNGNTDTIKLSDMDNFLDIETLMDSSMIDSFKEEFRKHHVELSSFMLPCSKAYI